jgi:hippurate hydrolase
MIDLKKYRTDLHKIPEIANKEFKTKQYLKETLTKMGYNPIDILATGLYVFIDNKNSKTIAFRSDIDALPTIEETGLSYSSTHSGYMHACGHDGHMSMLLGLADYLKDKQTLLQENVLLLFQPAEESVGGARRICETHLLQEKSVESIFGIHLYPEIEEGIIASKSGEFMASANLIQIEVFGRSSHGAMPELGVDSNLILSKIMIDLQTIQTRNVSPLERTIITFGLMEGGTVRNTISGYAKMKGSIRTFSTTTFNTIKERILKLAKGYETMYDCKVVVDIDEGYLSVHNHEELYKEFKNDLEDFTFIELEKPLMIAEDFSFYQRETKGVFYYIGTRNELDGYTHPLHSSQFNFNIKVLEIGLQTYITLLNKRGVINV